MLSTKNIKCLVGAYLRDSFIMRNIIFYLTRFFAMRGLNFPIRIGYTNPEYWESCKPGERHGGEQFITVDRSTKLALDPLLEVLPAGASYLEVGCNAGRNLEYLRQAGAGKLVGMEINRASIEQVLKTTYLELYEEAEFIIGDSARTIKGITEKSFDVVFSIAVLIHIPPASSGLFRDMVRVSKKYIVVITAENANYNFKKAFERHGCKEVYCRLFYGDDTAAQLPLEFYNVRKHKFQTSFLRIFIKNS